ncbi:LysM peptidoglycan-binding domain-containing protein [Bacillus sp. ISL-35]|uniref:LysM peptidoglycan-binding domain-containing protein n=1 Tax=Bacillus sp. ISL-35 TaxID=2819122 RepID=UPI001BE844FF|nr:LysM domain-containing protein [Bacillus sp. ISL-35]MBT2677482.1 LysM peptidoglycan-binding domain-containing protein [Bacillus sp. ISL-35]MBT2702130.1 LysM peptidoglycan-binding domain-containing protein [Chryseobacterium sp. ISL-80]
MKKLAGFLVFLVLAYAVYNDLSIGTLPAANTPEPELREAEIEEADSLAKEKIPYFEHEVKPGDTVLSVLDSNSEKPLAVPVSQAVEDFKQLNGGTDPQKIKFGDTYKFPDYSSQN